MAIATTDAAIAVVGSINTDLVVFTPHLPTVGETVSGQDLFTGGGGKGANQAVAAARLGARVHFVGRVGADAYGQNALVELTRENVDVRNVQITTDTPSGVALIMVGANGQNMIALAPGSNARITPEDIDRAWPCLSICRILLLQMEIPIEPTMHAARRAKSDGMFVILNPAPVPNARLPKLLLADIDMIVPNEAETTAITGLNMESMEDIRIAARALRELGPPSAIITLGHRGAYASCGLGEKLIPPYTVTVIDTTAAGDAFCGGLAVSLGRGMDVFAAAEFASRVAALSVTKAGARGSMPTSAELATFEEHAIGGKH